MARRVFHSFHYDNDHWRVNQVRNMGVVEGQRILSPNQWEEVKRAGDAAIKRWISDQMSGKSCVIVMIGSATAGRKWINYEIEKGWNDKKGVVGIYIHNVKDADRKQSRKGRNPFDDVSLDDGRRLSKVVEAHDPPYSESKAVLNYIRNNIEYWVERAIKIRQSV